MNSSPAPTVRVTRTSPCSSTVNDAGAPPDQEKGDGIFSSSGQPGGKPEAIADTRIRVAAMDNSHTVVVADAPLTGAELGVVSSSSEVSAKELADE